MHLAQGQPHHVALEADGGEGGGLGGALHRRNRAQSFAERVRIVGLDGGDAAPAKPTPARIGSASAMVLARPATSWRGLARSRKRTADAP